MKNFLIKNGHILFALGLLLLIIIIFILNNPYSKSDFSGGSGVIENKILLIKGWDKQNQFGIKIGSAISIKQQRYINQTILDHLKTNHKINKATVSGPIIGKFDKSKQIDQNSFYIKTNQNQKYKIIIDYNKQKVYIYYKNKLINL